jgi:hypothetical protein
MTEGVIVNPEKLVRLTWMLGELFEELRGVPLDDPARARLHHLLGRALVELGSSLPDDLLEELATLMVAVDDTDPSTAELRTVQAQLLGWLEGLLATARMAVTVEVPTAADH